MTTLSVRLNLNGINPIDPAYLLEEASSSIPRLPTSSFENKANSFRIGCGRNPGIGYFIYSYRDVLALKAAGGGTNRVSLRVFSGSFLTEYTNLVITSTKAIWPSLDRDRTPSAHTPMLVEVQDSRFYSRFGFCSLSSGYANGEGVPWAQINLAEAINFVWSNLPENLLGPPPIIFGVLPQVSLDWESLNQPAWDTLFQLLDTFSLTLTYLPNGRAFIFSQGDSDWALLNPVGVFPRSSVEQANLLEQYKTLLLDDYLYGSEYNVLPSRFVVAFQHENYAFQSTDTTNAQDSWAVKPVFEVEVQTTPQMVEKVRQATHGTQPTILPNTTKRLWAPYITRTDAKGALTNQQEAQQLARQLVYNEIVRLAGTQYREHTIYSGAVPVFPNPSISAVSWYDFGDGLKTEIARYDGESQNSSSHIGGSNHGKYSTGIPFEVPGPPDTARIGFPPEKHLVGILEEPAPGERKEEDDSDLQAAIGILGGATAATATMNDNRLKFVRVQVLYAEMENANIKERSSQDHAVWQTSSKTVYALNATGIEIPADYRVICKWSWQARCWLIVAFHRPMKKSDPPNTTTDPFNQTWTARCTSTEGYAELGGVIQAAGLLGGLAAAQAADAAENVTRVVVRRNGSLRLLRSNSTPGEVMLDIQPGDSNTVFYTPEGGESPYFCGSPKLKGQLTVGTGTGNGWVNLVSNGGVASLGGPPNGDCNIRFPSYDNTLTRTGANLFVQAASNGCVQLGWEPRGLNGWIYVFASEEAFNCCCSGEATYCTRLLECGTEDSYLYTQTDLSEYELGDVLELDTYGYYVIDAFTVPCVGTPTAVSVLSNPEACPEETSCTELTLVGDTTKFYASNEGMLLGEYYKINSGEFAGCWEVTAVDQQPCEGTPTNFSYDSGPYDNEDCEEEDTSCYRLNLCESSEFFYVEKAGLILGKYYTGTIGEYSGCWEVYQDVGSCPETPITFTPSAGPYADCYCEDPPCICPNDSIWKAEPSNGTWVHGTAESCGFTLGTATYAALEWTSGSYTWAGQTCSSRVFCESNTMKVALTIGSTTVTKAFTDTGGLNGGTHEVNFNTNEFPGVTAYCTSEGAVDFPISYNLSTCPGEA